MKIKTKIDHLQNCNVILPILGETKIENGIIDVQEDVAILLLDGSIWEEVVEETLEEDSKTNENDELDELNQLTIEQLKEVAKSVGIKNFGIFKNTETIKKQIRKKIKEQE